jgi:hypothetical protein
MTFQKMSAVVAATWLACCVLTAAGQTPKTITNAAGVRLMVADDADPTLRIVVPGYGDDGAFQVIFPQAVTKLLLTDEINLFRPRSGLEMF